MNNNRLLKEGIIFLIYSPWSVSNHNNNNFFWDSADFIVVVRADDLLLSGSYIHMLKFSLHLII